jgi:hypothetical protein
MKPLKTLNGSRIWYSKFGVGKQVGSKVYFHRSVWDKIVPEDVWNRALDILEIYKLNVKCFHTMCYDLKQPHILRFDTCPGFNFQQEPMVGMMFFVDIKNGVVTSKYNNQIYHHKWLWVNEHYDGFDVQESYEWSKHWLSKLPEMASGRVYLWEEQLKKYNII